jgi:hypothetical protein
VKFKLDENLGRGAAVVLVEAGFDVATASDLRLESASDREVIDHCLREERRQQLFEGSDEPFRREVGEQRAAQVGDAHSDGGGDLGEDSGSRLRCPSRFHEDQRPRSLRRDHRRVSTPATEPHENFDGELQLAGRALAR